VSHSYPFALWFYIVEYFLNEYQNWYFYEKNMERILSISLKEARQEKKKILRRALIQGEKSGYVINFNFKAHLKRLHNKNL
jgi:hypothetical protein